VKTVTQRRLQIHSHSNIKMMPTRGSWLSTLTIVYQISIDANKSSSDLTTDDCLMSIKKWRISDTFSDSYSHSHCQTTRLLWGPTNMQPPHDNCNTARQAVSGKTETTHVHCAEHRQWMPQATSTSHDSINHTHTVNLPAALINTGNYTAIHRPVIGRHQAGLDYKARSYTQFIEKHKN